ncbi:S-layer homology domain-containing protein, partial [Peptoniphilus sp. BV3AC2]|uniref:S-layer homology domain-containing protein n=1 Tax=Peptoniphilus sp. BV3AC2 TaxID=1111133 RepID=UPI0003B8D7CD
GDKAQSDEVKETTGSKSSAPDVKVKNNGDITVTPPTDAKKIIVKYTDPNGYPKEVEVTKDTNGNWNVPADSGLKFENGKIVIPANNVKPGTEVTATAVYPDGTNSTGSANASTNPQYPIYPGHDGYNGLPLWYFYGNFGSNNTKVEPKKEVKEVKERGHHEAYMYGYPDGTFRPNANITRAEAAAMISRLKGYSLNDKTAPEFKDSKVGWFKAAINAVFKNGLMKGYKDGNFRPNDKITRAEFAQMIKNIDKSNSAVATFKDVKGHWAEDAINQAFGNGRISGYPDGTFRPDAPITRAEAVKIANSLFERSVDNSGLKEKLENPTMISKFTDVNNTHWAFYEIMEATNSHEFERRENGKVVEDWLEIDKDKKH